MEPEARQARVVATGVGRCEGPVVRPDGTLAIVSMSHGCLFAIDGAGPRRLVETGGEPNGLAEGPDGTLYVAQTGVREGPPAERVPGGVQRVRADGAVEWLTQDPISPNDLCLGPDGLLYVTDPTRRPFRDGRLWACDPESGAARLLFSVPWYPNGIGFGPEGDVLYVADTSGARIVRYRLDGRRLGPEETFAELPYGHPDGFAFDVDGNLVLCAVRLDDEPGELQVFDRAGRVTERLRLTASPYLTNVALAPDGTAYVTDTTAGSVLALDGWARPGLLGPAGPR